MGRLDGLTVVVTGAARGLGRFVAEGFAAEGARLHLCDRIDGRDVRGATWHTVDLSDRAACENFVTDVGAIDVLVNNAAVLPMTAVESTTDDEWDNTLAVNLTAPFVLCRGFLPAMRERGGSIINVSSRAGVLGFEREVAYCASKFGVEGLTRALAAELNGTKVSVNTITPGMRIKPTMMTDAEEDALEPHERTWSGAEPIVPAFILLALARGNPTGKRFEADKLSDELKRTGVFSNE